MDMRMEGKCMKPPAKSGKPELVVQQSRRPGSPVKVNIDGPSISVSPWGLNHLRIQI